MASIDETLLSAAQAVFGVNLAGECANVNHMILKNFKSLFNKDVTIHIGWIEINGKEYFRIRESDSPVYSDGKSRFNYHVWLEGASYFIDLTLLDTLRDMREFDDSIIPINFRYIGLYEAKKLGIKYHTEQCGDNALEDLHKQIGENIFNSKDESNLISLSSTARNSEQSLKGLQPHELWLKKIPKGGPYPRGKFYFQKTIKGKRWTKEVLIEVLSPYGTEKYTAGSTVNKCLFKKYVSRIKRILPNFPTDVIETWLWEHSDQIEEFCSYCLDSLYFYEKCFDVNELLPIGNERNSPTFLNLRQLEDKEYQRNIQSNKDWPMSRLIFFISDNGTWPKKPIILDVTQSTEKPIINGYSVLSPWHIIEGRRRVAVLIHLRGKLDLKSRHKAWVVVIK